MSETDHGKDDWNRVKEDNQITIDNNLEDPIRRGHNTAEPIWTEDPTSGVQVDERPKKELEVGNQDNK